jgi:hypothetical protein
MDLDPDPLLLGKSGSAGNQIRDLWIRNQKLWPLDHRGGVWIYTGWIKIMLTLKWRKSCIHKRYVICARCLQGISIWSPSCSIHKNQRATAAYKARTHISRGIDDTTVCTLSFSSLILRSFLLHTRSFTLPYNQKSQGVKSVECGGHWIGPPRPIQRPGKV